jgi:hypothetical protein
MKNPFIGNFQIQTAQIQITEHQPQILCTNTGAAYGLTVNNTMIT